jgi:hypothetical protein
MADEEDEKTRLIRRQTPQSAPPPLPADDDTQTPEPGLAKPTRVLDWMMNPEGESEEKTKLVGPARRAVKTETPSAETTTSSDGGELDPVVGWLVVLAGPGRGNARRLGYGQNSLGRDKGERVSLDFGDGSISRSKHAFVLYEPRKRQFYLRPGDGANLTYLNGDLLADSRPLNPADVIEVGATKLRFVPLCGPDFDWEDQAQAAK